jgi:hypothetical protein
MRKARKHAVFGASFVKNPIFGVFLGRQNVRSIQVPQKINRFTRVGEKK